MGGLEVIGVRSVLFVTFFSVRWHTFYTFLLDCVISYFITDFVVMFFINMNSLLGAMSLSQYHNDVVRDRFDTRDINSDALLSALGLHGLLELCVLITLLRGAHR